MTAVLDLDALWSTQLYRPGTRKPDSSFSSNRWAQPIDRLLAARYTFLPCCYSKQGYLFRGIQSGLADCIASRSYGHFRGEDEVCGVEQAMNIFFLTHEISDALTVSKLFDGRFDGGIIALRSTVFNDFLQRGEAAVLGIGDAGIVFSYPLLTRSIPESDVEYVFVNSTFIPESTLAACASDKLVTVSGRTRRAVENDLNEKMQKLGIYAASPVRCETYPARS